MEDIRQQLIVLSETKKIKLKKKFLLECNDEVLASTWKEYQKDLLEETNEELANVVITQMSSILSYFKLVESQELLKRDLEENGLLKRDLKELISYITPYLPQPGIIAGVMTVGKHVVQNREELTEEVTEKEL